MTWDYDDVLERLRMATDPEGEDDHLMYLVMIGEDATAQALLSIRAGLVNLRENVMIKDGVHREIIRREIGINYEKLLKTTELLLRDYARAAQEIANTCRCAECQRANAQNN